jgi:hypothetical protein
MSVSDQPAQRIRPNQPLESATREIAERGNQPSLPAMESVAPPEFDLTLEEDSPPQSPIQVLIDAAKAPHPLRRPFRFIGWSIQMLFGIAALIALLAIVAAVPILNFLALGYLLEVEGRVARTGKLRDAFPLLHLAPRFGAISLGLWLWLWPLRFLAGVAADARLIDPGSPSDRNLHRFLFVLATLVAVHLCLALARGGRLSCFFRPIKNFRWTWTQLQQGGYWQQAELGIRDFWAELRVKHHFWLGFRGFVGGFAWLFLPTALFAAANKTEGGSLVVTLFGGFLLIFVLSWVPFLQARFAAENRLGAMRELRTVRQLYRNAPLCWLLGVVVTFALSLPLYLATVALPPSDAMWLVTVIFLVSIYPARVLVGWAYYQAASRQRPAWYGWRWASTSLMMPLLGFYVFLLFFTQFIGQHGKAVLFEHHALLLPIPF